MIRQYVECALRRARYDKLEDDSFVGEVRGLRRVLATADTLEECRDRLGEVAEEWVLVRVARGLRVPALEGISVAVSPKRGCRPGVRSPGAI
ncbi:MAG: type II toxin-antitoxin system HicB family antitoxin [Planctomycetes bacterium]|nr:type II toxin-antitoxin system HicB family antitoxin [Planctomycetota bacterium]